MDKTYHHYPDKGGEADCDYKTGDLPERAPLAVPFVPFQRKNPPQYSSDEGLTRGTIFPGLDLPWKNTVNKTHPAAGTEMGELMALDFALYDLALYLDTHENDHEAFRMYQYYLAQAKAVRENVVEKHGPISHSDMKDAKKYTWLKDPWPWEYTERMD